MTLRQLIFFFFFLLVGVSCKSGKKSATSINKHSAALLTPSAQIQTMNRGAIATPSALNCRDNEDCEVNGIQLLKTSLNVKKLTINGTLRCAPDLSGELKADVIYVNGTFECGTEQNRFMGSLTISLKDSTQQGEAYRGFIVNRNGVLMLHGDTKNSGFVKLNKTAQPGDTSIDLEASNNLTGASPSSWEPGDKIVVASTSYNPKESEMFSITGLTGTNLNLVGSLQHRHHGEIATYSTQAGNKVLDERAEVANLTRNIRIQAEQVFDERGGHVMVHKGGKAYIDAVEFFQLGRAGDIGRYPFHWHLVGNVRGQYLKNSSIHHSFQRCMVIHQTDWAHVENNVCYNFKGHGFMLEDGIEKNNTLQKNLAIYAEFPNPVKALRESEKEVGTGVDPSRFAGVSSFWISHPSNWVIENVASGSVGTGFWNSFAGNAKRASTHQFSGNIAHTTLVGHTWDGQEISRGGTFQVGPAHYNPRGIPVFSGLQAFKNKLTGIYFRGSTAIFRDAILADNRWALFLAFNNIIEKSLIVGEYKGNPGGSDSPAEQVGIVLYDGPWELNTVDFKDFDPNKDHHLPIKTIGGVDKWTNVSEKLAFSPEPKFRVYHKEFDDKQKIGDAWVDFIFANSIRDRDGSLTGDGPGVIVPSAQLTRHSGCKESSKFFGMVHCPETTRTFHARVNLSTDHFKTIFDVSRNGDLATNLADLPRVLNPSDDWKDKVATQGFHNKKFLMVSDPGAPETGVYTVSFPADTKSASLIVRSEKRGERSPVIRMVKEGSSKVCQGRVHAKQAESELLIKKSNRKMKIGVGTIKCVW